MSEHTTDGLNVLRGGQAVGVQIFKARERKDSDSMARLLVKVGRHQFNVNEADLADFKKQHPSAEVVGERTRVVQPTPAEVAASNPSPAPSNSQRLDDIATSVESLASAVAQLQQTVTELAARQPVEATLEASAAAPDDVEDMTKPQLLAYAAEKGFDLGGASKKADVLAAIQLAEEAAQQQPQS